MIKKAAIALFSLLIVSILIKVFYNSSSENVEPAGENISSDVQASKDSKTVSTPPQKSKPSLGENIPEDSLNEREEQKPAVQDNSLDKMEAYFDRIEKQWVLDITELFKEDLDLDDSVLHRYLTLRDEYENERLEKYEMYHERLIKEHGQDFRFHISEEEMQDDVRELNIKYRDKLRESIGDENYVRYLEFRDRFNEKIKTDDHIDFSGIEINF